MVEVLFVTMAQVEPCLNHLIVAVYAVITYLGFSYRLVRRDVPVERQETD